MWYHNLLVFLFVSTCIFAQEPVKVTVYYETLCPDSVTFVADQLKPTFDALGPTRMTVDFVPYGKGSHSTNANGMVFRNQHGHPEYLGNKMHACAIAALAGNPGAIVNFVACGMNSPSGAADIHRQCFASVPTAIKAKIRQCNDGAEGNMLLARHGDRTHTLVPKMSLVPNMGHVPRVEINGIYNVNEEQLANNDLKGLICTKLQGTPLQCASALPRNVPQAYGSPHSYPQYPQYPSTATQANPAWPGYNPYPGYPAYNPYPAYQPVYPGYPQSPTAYPTAYQPAYAGYPQSPTADPAYQPAYPEYPQSPTAYPTTSYPGTHTTQSSYNPYGAYPDYRGYPSPQPQPLPEP